MIFVGDIHGVGITSLCKTISQHYNFPYYSASQLIADMKDEKYSQNKLIENIDRNQNLLSLAVKKINMTDWFLLDGHFCLRNQHGEITHIPNDTFNHLSPKAIIVLTDSIQLISQRIAFRDKKAFDNQLLHSFQLMEIKYASSISSQLNSPFLNVNVSHTQSIFNFIEHLIS